jgi:aerobic carbon-monoxide dehydrogenase large subunit
MNAKPESLPHVGRSARRPRTAAFVRGDGRYIADLSLPGLCCLAIARSPIAHGRIKRIHTQAARDLPGVLAIYTGADVEGLASPPNLWQLPGQRDAQPRPLAIGRVRYVGDAVAAVVALDAEIARAACDAIVVEYDPLPVIMTIDAALAPDAPRLYEDWPDNVVARCEWRVGDVKDALTSAACVVADTFISGRVHPLPLEPRGVVASLDARDDTLTVWSPTQSVHQVREGIATSLGLPEHRIRVLAPDIGGSFGQKACLYPEEVLVAYAALRIKRPVRWLESRQEAFLASVHGRDQQVTMETGFAADGRLLCVRGAVVLDKGAEPYRTSIGTAWITGALLTGPYRVPVIDIEACGVVTNKTPTGAYRGFGQPEANFAMERTLDIAAARLRMDPLEIRRRNLPSPQELPCRIATGIGLDSGRYVELLELVAERAEWTRPIPQTNGPRRRGRGLAFYMEVTNFGPSVITNAIGVAAGGFDVASVRMEPSGHVRVYTGQTPMGQGVEIALTQICADELGIELADVAVTHGDTLACSYTAYASGGSRGAGVGGSAVALACRQLALKLRTLGAHLLSVDPDEVELGASVVSVRAQPERSVDYPALARVAYRGAGLPPGMPPGLEAQAVFDPPDLAIAYGAVAVDLEVDTRTGLVKLERIVFGHDCGPQINPGLVAGQVTGGIAQGVGCALFEELRFDADGLPLVQSLFDYPLPLAADLPPIELLHIETPTPYSVTGAKGVGESGVIAVPAAIANALQAALGSGAIENRLPLTPDRILSGYLRSGARSPQA